MATPKKAQAAKKAPAAPAAPAATAAQPRATRRAPEPKASFAPFEASPMSLIEEKLGKKKYYVVLEGKDGKRHFVMSGELSDLQEKNQDVRILINTAGEIAQEGEGYTLSDVAIGRNADGELHIV